MAEQPQVDTIKLIRPRPPWIRLPMMEAMILAIRAGDKTVTRRVPRRDGRPPCQPGDRVGFAEGLMAEHGLTRYRADGAPVMLESGSIASWSWKVSMLPSRYCPGWAIRTWATVESVSNPPLREMDAGEALREGMGCKAAVLGERPDVVMRLLWESMHGSWDPDARPWRIAFRDVVCLDESGCLFWAGDST